MGTGPWRPQTAARSLPARSPRCWGRKPILPHRTVLVVPWWEQHLLRGKRKRNREFLSLGHRIPSSLHFLSPAVSVSRPCAVTSLPSSVRGDSHAGQGRSRPGNRAVQVTRGAFPVLSGLGDGWGFSSVRAKEDFLEEAVLHGSCRMTAFQEARCVGWAPLCETVVWGWKCEAALG